MAKGKAKDKGKRKDKGKKNSRKNAADAGGKVAAADAKPKKRAKASGSKANKAGAAAPAEKLREKDYQHELRKLHVELVKLQEWARQEGLKV